MLKDILRPVYRSLLAAIHAGKECRCNLCGKSFSKMKPPIGIHADGTTFLRTEGEAGYCWKCNSYPRVRAVWHWLENDYRIQEKANLQLLHIAPEEQLAEKLLQLPGVTYTAVDKFCEGYHYGEFVKHADILDLPFGDSSFDMVICNHVLEHVKNDAKAMSELYRVLKPGGTALLIVPIDLSLADTLEEEPDEELSTDEREERFGQYDHVRLYGRDYFDRLERAGFQVERKALPSVVVKDLALDPDLEIVTATKAR